MYKEVVMKKSRILFALVTIALMLVKPSFVYAAEDEITIIAEDMIIRELSETEMLELACISAEEMQNDMYTPMLATSSYTAYEYSRVFSIYLEDTLVARISPRCTVWHYTDGKVHLYHRTITAERLASYDIGRTYGSIVNTDGSLSYTTGDRIHLYGLTNTWDFAIDFRVTPTEASFDCYEV